MRIAGSSCTFALAVSSSVNDRSVVPAGTPHWFYQVDETFLYYVVKATGNELVGGTK